ncbi:AsmA family protein [Phyllobacterium endophyticum]|uniref:AsmA family protein n=1 Tax=Phyllobacterium endophyticum TaxID=1149773 RepID=A0A2P7B127_9HYPH|nr:AsmA-like C-terminal region-containing protein [Phyllobacterium endophyticum]MBB3237722.1 AsmA protein [Phyllobacterium endophyticum]PSH60178.1 AsmA family protein [Phyllobacterium endophyticum]TYR42345.1 AsmA family protein [Phyllobacterium endophyticum]
MSFLRPRNLLATALLLALAAAGVVAALPFLVSTDLIRARLIQEISNWTGYSVESRQTPQITFFPAFTASLGDITIRNPWQSEGAPFMQAERIEVDLSLLSALLGKTEFTETKIVRPRFVIDEPIKSLSEIGEALSRSDGRIGDVVREARAAVEANPAKPDMSTVSSQPFGRVRLEDAMVTFKRPINGAEEQISSISGVFDWPQTSGVASFQGKAIWHGEETEIDSSATRALLLLAGGTSPLQVNISSTPLTLSFNGSANISKDQFFEGTLSLTSPSLRRTLEWSRMATIPGAPIGSFALDASVSGSATRMKLDGLTATLNDNPAKGVIEIVLDQGTPSVTGTLAFDTLDIHSVFAGFMPLPDGSTESDAVIDSGFLKQLNLDLRVSTQVATIGTINLSKVAATAQIRNGRAMFDIGEATAFDGSVAASFQLADEGDGATTGELRLNGTDVNSASIAALMGFGSRFQLGKGTMSLVLKGPISRWSSALANAKGTLSMRFGSGQIRSLDFNSLLSKAKTDRFFSLNEKTDAWLAFDRFEVKANIMDGVAALDTAQIVTKSGTLSFAGIVTLIGKSLALTGDFAAQGAAAATETAGGTAEAARPQMTANHTRFFIGGSWDNPFISPIISQ